MRCNFVNDSVKKNEEDRKDVTFGAPDINIYCILKRFRIASNNPSRLGAKSGKVRPG